MTNEMTRKPRISGQLTMREACIMLGWVGPRGKPTNVDMLRLRRRLRRAEQVLAKRMLFGGSEGRGRGGGRCWTTTNALRHAGLLDDFEMMTEAVREVVGDLREAVDTIHDRQRAMARSLAQTQGQLRQVAARMR